MGDEFKSKQLLEYKKAQINCAFRLLCLAEMKTNYLTSTSDLGI